MNRRIGAALSVLLLFLSVSTVSAPALETRQTVSLAGGWSICPAKEVSPDKYVETGPWAKAGDVPYIYRHGRWPNQDMHCAAFKRDFALPAAGSAEKSVRINFGTIDDKGVIYVNGRLAGSHVGGGLPLSMDITPYVKWGDTNQAVVYITDWTAIIKNYTKVPNADQMLKNASDPWSVIGRDGVLGGLISPLCNHVERGIRSYVCLEIASSVYVDRVRIETSVTDKTIKVTSWVRNDTAGPRTVTLTNQALFNNIPEKSLAPKTLEVAPNSTSTITVTEPWSNPKYWSFETPNLYALNTSIFTPDGVTDTLPTIFGFREFRIGDPRRGEDPSQFYLNGAKVKLKDTTDTYYHPPYEKNLADAEKDMKDARAANINIMRFETNLPSCYYDAADKYGVMIDVQIPLLGDQGHWYAVGDDLFWKNSEDYILEMMEGLVNHPSVVLYSLSNEMWHNDAQTRDRFMRGMRGLQAGAKEYDGTRAYICDDGDGDLFGIGDIYSDHGDPNYPSRQGYIDAEVFPQSMVEYPPGSRRSIERYPGFTGGSGWKWKKDKPLYLGEAPYWLNVNDYQVNSGSTFVGDRIYQRDAYDRMMEATIAYWSFAISVLRSEDVSAIGPFTLFGGSGDSELPTIISDGLRGIFQPVAVRLVDYDSRFFSNRDISRTLFIYNDVLSPNHYTLSWSLKGNDGRVYGKDSFDLDLGPGDFARKDISFATPPVSARTGLSFQVSLLKDGAAVDSLSRDYAVYPDTTPGLPAFSLFDPKGKTASLLTRAGISYAAVVDLKDLAPGGVLIVGQDSLDKNSGQALKDLVDKGTRVLILRQVQDYTNTLPARFPTMISNSTSIVFPRLPSHPVLSGLTDRDFSFWRGGADSAVSRDNFIKPYFGNYRILLDNGGISGLTYTPLIELSYGKGDYLCSQLEIVDKYSDCPIARTILANSIRYLASYKPDYHSLAIFSREGSALSSALSLMNLKDDFATLNEVKDRDVLLMEGDPGTLQQLKDANFDLQAFVRGGGVILIEGLQQSALPLLTQLAGFSAALSAPGDQNYPLQLVGREGPTAGMANYDLFWQGEAPGMGQIAQGEDIELHAYAPRLTRDVLSFSCTVSDPSAQVLISPGALIRVPSGKGCYLIDQVNWTGGMRSPNKYKALRYFSSLLTNLGVSFSPAEVPAAQAKTKPAGSFFPIDISSVCNRGFADEVAGDNKGGWTDEGPTNDLRSMPTGSLDFAGVPFKVVDPAKNNGNSCIVLGSQHAVNLPMQVTIPVNRKADRLYFLQTAGWGNDFKETEVFHYQVLFGDYDGTRVPVPVKEGINVADWWSEDGDLPGATAVAIPAIYPDGRKLFRSIYIQEWKNTYRDVPIKEITVISENKSAIPIVIAVTGEVD